MRYPFIRRWPAGRLLAVAALAATVACGDDPTPAAPPTAPAAAPRFLKAGPNGPVIAGVSPEPATIRLDASATFTVTLHSPGGSTLQNVSLTSEIIQGGVHRAAGTAAVDCHGALGTLPPGACTTPLVVTATAETLDSFEALAPGVARLVVSLVEQPPGRPRISVQPPVVLDADTIPVTLLPHQYITGFAFESLLELIVLELPPVPYAVTLSNPTGASLSGLRVQGTLVQDAVSSDAGGAQVQCGADPGVLPPGNCTMHLTLTATNVDRPQTLVPGPATFIVAMLRFDPATETTTELDRRSIPVTIRPAHPYIASLSRPDGPVLIGGAGLTYTMTIVNPTGATLSTIELESALFTVAGVRSRPPTSVTCGQGAGVLAPGTCTMTLTMDVSKQKPPSYQETGSLAAGSAVLNVFLAQLTPSFQVFNVRGFYFTLIDPVLR